MILKQINLCNFHICTKQPKAKSKITKLKLSVVLKLLFKVVARRQKLIINEFACSTTFKKFLISVQNRIDINNFLLCFRKFLKILNKKNNGGIRSV